MHCNVWILMTMVTRPLMWILAATLLFPGVLVFFVDSDKYGQIDVGVIQSTFPIRTLEQLQEANDASPDRAVEINWGSLAHDQLDQVLPRSTDGGVRHMEGTHHAVVDERLTSIVLPDKVEAIQTHSWAVRQSTLDRLGKVTSLKRLGLLVAFNEDLLDLSPLTTLRQLETLDVGLIHSVFSLSPLRELPRLSTLSVGSQQLVTKERMAEVAKLESLNTIFLPDLTENERAMDALAELDQSKSLERIYVLVPLSESGTLAAIQTRVPQIDVRSSTYLQWRLFAFAGAIWVCAILGMLGMHFAGQFSLPIAQLAPRYRESHQVVVWSVMGVLIICLTTFLCFAGAHMLPVIAAIALALTTSVRSSVVAQRTFDSNSNTRIAIRFIILIIIMAVIWVFYSQPMLLEEYLMGATVVPVILLALSCVVVTNLKHSLDGMCRERIESGRPLMLSMYDAQCAGIDLRSRRLEAANQRADTASIDPFVRTERSVLSVGLFALAIVVLSYAFPALLRDFDLSGYVVMACCFAVSWSLSVIGKKWWQRMPYMTGMIPRPPRRNRQIDDLFQGVIFDFRRLWPVVIGTVLVISNTAFFSPQSTLIRVGVGLLLVGSVLAICYAAIMWILLIRSVRGIAILCFVGCFGVAMLTAGTTAVVMIVGSDSQQPLPTYGVLLVAGVLTVIAITAMVLARRCYRRLEWARFA